MSAMGIAALIAAVYVLAGVIVIIWVRSEGENWPNSLLCGAIWPFYVLLLIGDEL